MRFSTTARLKIMVRVWDNGKSWGKSLDRDSFRVRGSLRIRYRVKEMLGIRLEIF